MEVYFVAFIWMDSFSATATAATSLQSCPTLSDPIDGSPPGSPVPGILQARTLEWVAISFSKCMKVKSESDIAQSCPTLSDPMDCSPPGSSIHGIFQARGLEWAPLEGKESGTAEHTHAMWCRSFPGNSHQVLQTGSLFLWTTSF